jgi:hypothetical protein
VLASGGEDPLKAWRSCVTDLSLPKPMSCPHSTHCRCHHLYHLDGQPPLHCRAVADHFVLMRPLSPRVGEIAERDFNPCTRRTYLSTLTFCRTPTPIRCFSALSSASLTLTPFLFSLRRYIQWSESVAVTSAVKIDRAKILERCVMQFRDYPQ